MATLEPDPGSCRDPVVVSLCGELDILSSPAAFAVVGAAAIRGQFVLVDLAELDFLDCSVVASLMRARVVARASAGDVVLANPHGSVLRLLTILDRLRDVPAEPSPSAISGPALSAVPDWQAAPRQRARFTRTLQDRARKLRSTTGARGLPRGPRLRRHESSGGEAASTRL